ncbi:cupin domain-containing protein [Paraburkholderia atlantica]|uniref:cupin domain-containing protein n=1 Tax=Paraburkholderia atlantica TaxID=2654982 RepID=UPI00160A3748|nr:cupin domain-containing protein [Paraburkholderia atlantica]MBB5509235.1 hypothetical protein [Paraburkholderia atlantica]
MKVQQIKQSIALQGPEDWSTAGLARTPEIRVSEPGIYRRSVRQSEVMHFLSGRGRFTPDGEDAIHFTGGDTLFFEAHTEGTWEVEETMRKVYVIF